MPKNVKTPKKHAVKLPPKKTLISKETQTESSRALPTSSSGSSSSNNTLTATRTNLISISKKYRIITRMKRKLEIEKERNLQNHYLQINILSRIITRMKRKLEIEKDRNLQNHYLQNQFLKLWPLLCILETDFLLQIEIIMWYGWKAEPVQWNTALIITIDKNVYSLSDKNNQIITDNMITLRTQKVKALCQKNIKSMIHTNGCTIVLTEQGKVYSWGSNINSICGRSAMVNEHGTINATIPYPLEVFELANKCVVDIKCGDLHVLVLTKDREIYSWGTNYDGQVGDTDANIVPTPMKVIIEDELGKKDIQSISCGSTFSMAITCDGKLYGWGKNTCGQLGLGDNSAMIHRKPMKIMINVAIAKVECGFNHTLALTHDGLLYVWGDNKGGQLGTGNYDNSCYPILMDAKKIGKVTDIAARFDSSQSVAINTNKRIYKWGTYDDCHGHVTKVNPTVVNLNNIDDNYYHGRVTNVDPTVVNLNNIDNAFINFQNVIKMQNPCTSLAQIQEFSYVMSEKYLKTAFNNSTSADTELIVEQQSLYIHRNIIMIRCPKMYTKFFRFYTDRVITREDFSAISYKIFLQYLYTGVIDIPSEKLLEPYYLATNFDSAIFKKNYLKIIKKKISISNVIYFYGEAILQKIMKLEEFCFKYAINNLTAVIKSESFAELPDKLRFDFIIKAANAQAFKN
nr:PREDICTED: RCC1 and BTB domain-containing protein 1-like isoform X1 [Linepithema humile]